jgi:hypothetical protein
MLRVSAPDREYRKQRRFHPEAYFFSSQVAERLRGILCCCADARTNIAGHHTV